MIKNLTGFALEIEGKLYQIICQPDAPTQHCKEFAYQFLKYIGQIEDSAKKTEEELKIENNNQEQ